MFSIHWKIFTSGQAWKQSIQSSILAQIAMIVQNSFCSTLLFFIPWIIYRIKNGKIVFFVNINEKGFIRWMKLLIPSFAQRLHRCEGDLGLLAGICTILVDADRSSKHWNGLWSLLWTLIVLTSPGALEWSQRGERAAILATSTNEGPGCRIGWHMHVCAREPHIRDPPNNISVSLDTPKKIPN